MTAAGGAPLEAPGELPAGGPPAPGPPAAEVSEVEVPWSRLHPLTPLLRSGRALAVVAVVLVGQGGQRPPLLLGLGVLLLVAVLAIGGGAASWRATRFRVHEGVLQLDSGVLVRRNRRVPLARVQGIDVVRPVVGRVLGLAELRLEVAGDDTEAKLAYLAEADAVVLRERLLGARPGQATEEPAAERVLVAVPTSALVHSLLLSGASVGVVVLLAPLVVAFVVDVRAGLALAASQGLVVLASIGVVVSRFTREYGFTVAEGQDGLRVRHGLLETRARSIPTGRVQALRVAQPLLWRRKGWVRVEVDVAGVGGSGEEQATTATLLPVAPRALADALVARVLGTVPPPAAARAPRRARWLDPLAWRRTGCGLDDRVFVGTSGWLVTRIDVVPLAKVQGVRLRQGPLQRRLRLASVHADAAGSRVRGAAAWHVDDALAPRLLEDVVRAAQAAR